LFCCLHGATRLLIRQHTKLHCETLSLAPREEHSLRGVCERAEGNIWNSGDVK
jgi:hypothetical protein